MRETLSRASSLGRARWKGDRAFFVGSAARQRVEGGERLYGVSAWRVAIHEKGQADKAGNYQFAARSLQWGLDLPFSVMGE